MAKITIYCPRCKKYSGNIVKMKSRKGISDGLKYKERIAYYGCAICGYQARIVLDIKPLKAI